MGKELKLNRPIYFTAFVAFQLTTATIILCILILADDDECNAVAQCTATDVGISAKYPGTYPCSPNPCKNDGRCFTSKVKENCMCPIGYMGKICLDPASINVTLHSQNVCKPNISACGVSSIQINGSVMNITEPGLTFLILNATTGNQIISRRFETSPEQTKWNDITEFLTFLPIEVIILMVLARNGTNYLKHTIPVLALTLNNQLPKNVSHVSSWVLAGYKGVLGVGWTTSRKSCPHMGSANVTLSIPIVGVGRDCRQCNPMSCLKIVDGFVCECAAGYTGPTCSQEIKECYYCNVLKPCQNNGTCVDGADGYTCYCRPGFNGTNCESVKSV